MRRRKSALVAAALFVILVLLAGGYLKARSQAPTDSPSTDTASTASGSSAGSRGAQRLAGAPGASNSALLESARGSLPPQEGDLVSYLRSKFGEHIRNPYVQMKMLEDLIRHFRAKDPKGWKDAILALLKQAFPELYDELATRLQQWLDYEEGMQQRRAAMREMGDKERRAATWEFRNQLFGKEAAEKIWAAELRNQAVGDALQAIDARPDVPLPDKLSQFKQSLKETYGEHTEAYVQRHQQELMNRFLDLSSVQKDLGTLPAEQRAENLRMIRKEMGLDEEALARWNELDKVRDTRWETGSLYMSEREALAQQYSGDELEAKLQELRVRYFGGEAETIAHEEQNGFFRFTRERKWGRE